MVLLVCLLAMFVNKVPDLDALAWHNRVLLVFAPSEDDHRQREQHSIFIGHEAGFDERDLQVFTLIGEGAEVSRLREKLHIAGQGFVVVLIGKDGGVKLRKSEPVSAEQLFRTIDSMPMRKQEIKQSKQ